MPKRKGRIAALEKEVAELRIEVRRLAESMPVPQPVPSPWGPIFPLGEPTSSPSVVAG